jgi:hypothetical protein
MRARIASALVAGAMLLVPAPVVAQAPMAVCAPGNTGACIIPNANGSIAVTGGSGGGGGGGTGSAPTQVVLAPPVPASIAATTGTYVSTCALGSGRIDWGATLSQAGTLKINRYLSTTCTIPVAGQPVQGAAAATVPTAIAASDGASFQSYTVEIDNTTASVSTISNAIALLTPSGTPTGAPVYLDANGNQVQPVQTICNGAPCGQLNPAYTVFAAGELHVGEFGNNQTTAANALGNTATSYAAGVAIGGLQTVAGMARVSGAAGTPGTGGDILATVLTSSVANTVQVDVVYFSATLTTSTCTDTTAFALTAADATKVVGVAHVTDWSAGNPAAVGQVIGPPIPYVLNNATSLFACVVARGVVTVAASGVNLQVRTLRQ